MFVGSSREQKLFQTMPERLAGIPDGIRGALTYFTRPYYFVPTIEAIAAYSTLQDEGG